MGASISWLALTLLVMAISSGSDAKAGRYLKETNVVFYMQDQVNGEGRTGIPVVGANGLNSSVLNFGTVTVIDHLLTEGFERNSTMVGRARGLYVDSALDGRHLHFLFSVIFMNEKYNGSSIEIQGPDPLPVRVREIPVVSGTGVFRFARGYALMETAYGDPVTLNAVLKFNVTVLH